MTDHLDPPADDEMDIELRTAAEVAYRAGALVSLVRRGLYEIEAVEDEQATETDEYAIETDRFDLESWTMTSFHGHLTDEEANLLTTPSGMLGSFDLGACQVALPAAEALQWALGGRDALQFTAAIEAADIASTDALFTWAPKPWDDIARFASRAKLRDEATIAHALQRAELWLWRIDLEDEDLQAGERRVIVAEVSAEARAAGLIATLNGDFELDGRPYHDVDTTTHALLLMAVEQRYRALAWVCGAGKSWDDVPRELT